MMRTHVNYQNFDQIFNLLTSLRSLRFTRGPCAGGEPSAVAFTGEYHSFFLLPFQVLFTQESGAVERDSRVNP